MFVDYEYYRDSFGGTSLTETEFNKYVPNACMKITTSTLSRVTDSTINSYPSELVTRIKNCACSLSEWEQKFDKALNTLSSGITDGIAKSKSAGAVSVTYDTSFSLNYLLDTQNQSKIVNSVVNSYLAPICINGTFYNLLSKVLSSPKNTNCSINLSSEVCY